MRRLATLANLAWLAAGASASRRFTRALAAPREAQEQVLREQLGRGIGSTFGERFELAAVRGPADFARKVPLADYRELEPWIDRIRAGDKKVLSSEEVTHLVPTSGSTGARKLIPFTASLGRAFDAAVAPWMRDLARKRPGLVDGPAYWSISPLAAAPAETSVVPIGFADDAQYLGGLKAWLVGQVLAVPASARLVREEAAFWPLVLLALLRQRELRLVSVWHPSFFELLVGAAAAHWPDLLEAVASGENPWREALPATWQRQWAARPDRRRAAELRLLGPEAWPAWWPRLQVLSCWGEQAARGGCERLQKRLPGVLVQPKGLLASEAVVTVPLGEARPLALTSHFFEFLDDRGEIRLAHQLERGGHYEVVVTAGCLWRYRLGDLVECTGHLAATPSLRFLGRAGNVSDLRGEKLAEAFVAEALRALWGSGKAPSLAVLEAWEEGHQAGYQLLLSREDPAPGQAAELTGRLESLLAENPHYALARRLGQLEPLRLVELGGDAAAERLRQAGASGVRLGDIKPNVLVARPPCRGPRSCG